MGRKKTTRVDYVDATGARRGKKLTDTERTALEDEAARKGVSLSEVMRTWQSGRTDFARLDPEAVDNGTVPVDLENQLFMASLFCWLGGRRPGGKVMYPTPKRGTGWVSLWDEGAHAVKRYHFPELDTYGIDHQAAVTRLRTTNDPEERERLRDDLYMLDEKRPVKSATNYLILRLWQEWCWSEMRRLGHQTPRSAVCDANRHEVREGEETGAWTFARKVAG